MKIYFFLILIFLVAEPCFSQYYSNRYFSGVYKRQDCQEPKGFFQKLFSYFNRNLKACSFKTFFNEQLINPSGETVSRIIEDNLTTSTNLEPSATSLPLIQNLETKFKQTILETIYEEDESLVENIENELQDIEPFNFLASPNEVNSITTFVVEDTTREGNIGEVAQVMASAFVSDVACVTLSAIFVPAGVILALEEIYLRAKKSSYEAIKYAITNEDGIIFCQGKKNVNLAELKENKYVVFEHDCKLEKGKVYKLIISTFDGKVLLEDKYIVAN